MNLNILSEKKLENAVVELEIEIPLDRVEDEYKSVFNKIQKKAKVDGFRQGKAPLQIVETKYKEYAGEEVAENLAKSSFYEAITKKEIVPIVEPRISFESISRDQPFKYKAVFEVMPTIELAEYTGIEADERVCNVTEEDLEREINSIREKFSDIEVITDNDAAIVKGNLVRFKLKRIDNVSSEEADKLEFNEYNIIVGKSKDEYTLDKDIVGMKKGDEKKVTIKYPENYHMADLASQEVTYLVNITEISSMKLPEANDELAIKSGYESIDDMKTKIRDYLEKFVKDRVVSEVRNDMITKIADKSTFDIPESMVLNEMYSLFKKTQQRIGYNSDSIDQFAMALGLNPEEYKARLREDAYVSIRHTLILSEIAKKENLEASEEKYKETLENFSVQLNKSVQEVEQMIAENDSKSSIENDIVLERAMELVYQKGNIKKLPAENLEDFVRSKMGQQ